MSKPPLTPGDIALADQFQAEAGTAADALRIAVREGDAVNGEAQNFANFVAFLVSDFDPYRLAAMLVTAVRRIPPQETP